MEFERNLSRVQKTIFRTMPDGTTKQINPFTDMEVWTIPGRKNKPITNARPKNREKIHPDGHNGRENYCNFCEARYANTPPEKGRLMRESGNYTMLSRLNPDRVFSEAAEFRRIPNLFEIVTTDYWRKNYHYQLHGANREWKERYLSHPKGLQHVLNIVHLKLKLSGLSEDDLEKKSLDEKLELATAFFCGGHELIVARKHYTARAEYTDELCSSGELTQDEHFQYFKFTIEAMRDIYAQNRYVRYISVFQNWLRDAGASFDHLHKQLVALDEWGTSVERELSLVRRYPNIYNELAVNFASYNNLVIAENDHAIAFVDIGHIHPTLVIYSKSEHFRPPDHTDEELWGFSSLVHACHAAMGNGISCNEEWYYTPRDSMVPMPWHILIKWRINNPAGFEGGTKIHINPMELTDLRDQMVPRLYELRDKKIIDGFKIAEECPLQPNCLRYNHGAA
ncbi:MAG: DUF4921 family protein [bacterium]